MKLRLVTALGISAALLLSSCAVNEEPSGSSPNSGSSSSSASLKGQLRGSGASSAKVAQENWIAAFQTANSGVTINYSPDGSGAGREAFQGGGVDFAGSDRAFKMKENVAGKFGKCKAGSKALDLPIYISPIAIVFNVDGVTKLNLDPETLAAIFKGDIKNWNDPKIAKLNPGTTFPDLAIAAVHRSDDSGTTENFTDYLAKVAKSVWDKKAGKSWPYQGGEAAKGTSGVIAAVTNGKGTIGYADESQAGKLGVANIGKNGTFNPPSAEAAARLVEISPIEKGRDAHDLAIDLDREGDGYPIILVSYALVCAEYKDAKTAELVKAYMTYVASEEGQATAAKTSGSAPLSAALRAKVKASIDSIK